MMKIVTDSVSDLTPDLVKEFDITVIPLNVNCGTVTFRDRVDMTTEDFYYKLENSSVLPTTSAPSPGIFAEIFDDLALKSDEILGIFVSQKLSATYAVALQGIKLMKRKCHVEIVDSTLGIMGEGLLVIEAAKKALIGFNLNKTVNELLITIPQIHVRVTLDTLKYLVMGGRVNKAQAFLGSMLRTNPILGLKDGKVFSAARVRSRSLAIDWLNKFVTTFSKIKAVAVEYGTNSTEAKALAKSICSKFPEVPIYLSNVSPVIGTHTGPNVLSVSVLGGGPAESPLR